MIFSQINIKRTLTGSNIDDAFLFFCRGHFISHYLETRVLKTLKFQATFQLLAILAGSSRESCESTDRVITVSVPEDLDDYHLKHGEDLYSFYGSLLIKGLSIGSNAYNLPVTELLTGLDELKNNKWKNSWIHGSKKLPKSNRRIDVRCTHSESDFVISLEIREGDEVIFSKDAVGVDPNPFIYHYLHGKVIIEDDKVILMMRGANSHKPTFIFNLSTKSFKRCYRQVGRKVNIPIKQ